jgi:hypothetical protein
MRSLSNVILVVSAFDHIFNMRYQIKINGRKCDSMTYRHCDFTNNCAGCANKAYARVPNDFGREGWYCLDHIRLFEEQSRRRARIAAWFRSLLGFGRERAR